VPPAVPGRPRQARQARRPRLGVAAGLAGGIAAAGLLGWLLATVLVDPPPGPPAPAGQVAASHPPATPARSAASVRTVTIGTALLGRPVSVVRRELRSLGLVVEVRPRRDEQAAPGSVVQIYPTGQVAAGSVVLVTAATLPAPSAPAPAPATRATPAGPAASATASPKGKPTPPGHAKHSKGPRPGPG
jgi:hypothetical protein